MEVLDCSKCTPLLKSRIHRRDNYIFYTKQYIKRKTDVRYREEKDESPGLGNNPHIDKDFNPNRLSVVIEGRAGAFWEDPFGFCSSTQRSLSFLRSLRMDLLESTASLVIGV